jgi:hypothetical protein
MKRKRELDVDFIGEQYPLTKQEEKIISDFLKSRSIKKRRTKTRKKASGRKLAA